MLVVAWPDSMSKITNFELYKTPSCIDLIFTDHNNLFIETLGPLYYKIPPPKYGFLMKQILHLLETVLLTFQGCQGGAIQT